MRALLDGAAQGAVEVGGKRGGRARRRGRSGGGGAASGAERRGNALALLETSRFEENAKHCVC